MYTPSNTPNGYFEEYIEGKWQRISTQRVAEAIREAVQLGYIPDSAAAYDKIVQSGLIGVANGVRTRRPIRFE